MTIASTLRRIVGPTILRIEELEEAGTFGGAPLYQHAGKVYTLGSWAQEGDPRTEGLVVSRPRLERDNGRTIETGREYARLLAVSEAVIEQAAEKQRARAARAASKATPRPVDLLGMMPALGGRPEHIVGGAFVEGKPSPRGPAAIVEMLQRKGIALEVTASGKLLAQAPGRRMPLGMVQVIQAARTLLVAYLSGQPLRCEAGKHEGQVPEAVTMAVLDVPACEEHAG